jgi:hypothetical protein
MSENSSLKNAKDGGDIFDDDGESFESDNKEPTLAPNILNGENERQIVFGN